MVAKSVLKATITEVFEENDVDDKNLAEELFDRLLQDFGEEIYDDEDEEDEDDGVGLNDNE